MRGSGLPWDRIYEKLFEGPSIYLLCKAELEDMEHILNVFPYTRLLRDRVSQTCGIFSYSPNYNIIDTIINWDVMPFKIPIINRA